MLRIYADFEKGKTKCSEKSCVEKLIYVGLCQIFALKAFFFSSTFKNILLPKLLHIFESA
jgi:hypothetical protein